MWIAEEVIRANHRWLASDEEKTLPQYESSADIWSFGLVLLFMFTAKYHTNPEAFEKAEFGMIRNKDPFPRPVIPAGLLPPFDSIIKECLDSNPTRRPTSEGLRKRFQEALEALTEPTPTTRARRRISLKKN